MVMNLDSFHKVIGLNLITINVTNKIRRVQLNLTIYRSEISNIYLVTCKYHKPKIHHHCFG